MYGFNMARLLAHFFYQGP